VRSLGCHSGDSCGCRLPPGACGRISSTLAAPSAIDGPARTAAAGACREAASASAAAEAISARSVRPTKAYAAALQPAVRPVRQAKLSAHLMHAHSPGPFKGRRALPVTTAAARLPQLHLRPKRCVCSPSKPLLPRSSPEQWQRRKHRDQESPSDTLHKPFEKKDRKPC